MLRDGLLVGIFSERDVMNRVVAAGRTPGTTKVSEVMTPNPRGVDVNESAEECLFLMKEFGFRQPIVVDSDDVIVVGHTRWKAAQKGDLILRQRSD